MVVKKAEASAEAKFLEGAYTQPVARILCEDSMRYLFQCCNFALQHSLYCCTLALQAFIVVDDDDGWLMQCLHCW